MATAKKKSKKNSMNKVSVIVTILIILLGIGVFIFVYRNEISHKVDKITPPAFNYPTKYEEYVVKYSKKYKVNPVLVYSVIKVESNFNPDAKSNVGARGLMQIMEDAYDWIKFRLNDNKSTGYDDMYDPETNIKYGTYYLSYLMDKYDNSIQLTAAAYHCGMGLVDSWIEDGTIDKNHFDVNDIPDENDQTSYYVTKIMDAYDGYSKQLSASSKNDSE